MESERLSEVGWRIRSIRTRKHMTLRGLSAASQLSVGFLSQIERGLSSFSISSLRAICQALDVSLPDVLVMSDAPGNAILVDPRHASITKGDNRPYVSLSDASIKYRFLSAGFPARRFEAVIGEMAPGSHRDLYVHEGEELGYVLEGGIVLFFDEEERELGPGDSYHLMASTPHGCRAEENGARILWVQTARYVRALSLLGSETAAAGLLPPSPIETRAQPAPVDFSQYAIRYRFLSGNLPKAKLRVFVTEIPAERVEEPPVFEGEEFGYVLEGRIHLTIDEDSYPMEAGDCYHGPAAAARVYRASGPTSAKLLWVQMGAGPREVEAVWNETVEKAVDDGRSEVRLKSQTRGT